MESFIADLINNPRVPKWLRCVIVVAVCGLVVFLSVMLIIKSPMIVGTIFGGVLTSATIAAIIYLFIKIAKSKQEKDKD